MLSALVYLMQRARAVIRSVRQISIIKNYREKKEELQTQCVTYYCVIVNDNVVLEVEQAKTDNITVVLWHACYFFRIY